MSAAAPVAMAALRRALRRRNYLGGFVVLFGHALFAPVDIAPPVVGCGLLIPVALFD
jgi:hypothetical protein